MLPIRVSLRNLRISCTTAFAVLFLMVLGLFPCNAAGRALWSPQESGRLQHPAEMQSQEPQPAQSQETQPQETQVPVSNYQKPVFQKLIPNGQLAFLNHFQGAASKDVIRDKEYPKLMHRVIPDCMFHYGKDMPLTDAREKVLTGSTLPVQIRDGRYVMASGQSGPYLMGRGFMWIDLQDGIALGGFYFHPTNGEPTPTINIFSQQVKEKSLKMSQLPASFAEDFSQWSADSRVAPVTTRYFITGSNEKILLEHDEHYCAPTAARSAPPDNRCEQMNADAADIDMSAAYYVDQTHHATNATAWMITGEDQVTWIQVRYDTCRITPDPLSCHIRMTRERTHRLISQ